MAHIPSIKWDVKPVIHWKGSGTLVTGTAQVTLRFAKQYLEPGEVAEGGEKTRLQGGAGKSYLGFSNWKW